MGYTRSTNAFILDIRPPCSLTEFNDIANGQASLQKPNFKSHFARRVEFADIFNAAAEDI